MLVLIADDEKMARISLKLMLEEMALPDLDLIECNNGEDLLKQLEICRPELAFVDIHMPVMNGLEAIEEAKKISPDTVYTIVTGYQEFEFARKAIELRVDNYLLKPAAKEDLAKVVQDSIKKSKQKSLEMNRNFERRTIARFHSVDDIILSGEDKRMIKQLSHSRSMLYVFDSRSEDILKKAKADFFLKLRSIAENYISHELMIAVFNISSDMIYILCSFAEETLSRTDKFLYSCERLDRGSCPEVMISCFKKRFNSRDISAQYSDMIELSLLRILFRDTGRHDLSRYENDRDREKLLNSCRLLNTLSQAFNQKNVTGFFNILDRLAEDKFFLDLLKDDLRRQNINAYLRIHTGYSSDGSASTPVAWMDHVREYGNGLLSSRNSCRRYIDDVIDYVEQNYMKDIGINSIAAQLNITPNYLSRLFHNETKMKFTDYIAKTRISHARRLLSESSLTIREISEEVGYRSSRHFTNLFVKFTGEYPSKYRKARSSDE